METNPNLLPRLVLFVFSANKTPSNHDRILNVYSYNTCADVISCNLVTPGEVTNALDGLTALSCSRGSSSSIDNISECGSVVYKGHNKENQDEQVKDNIDSSGSFFNLTECLNKICEKYNIMALYNTNNHDEVTLKTNKSQLDEFNDDFEVIEEDDKSSSESEDDDDSNDIYGIKPWLKMLKNNQQWTPPVRDTYFDIKMNFNTSYDMDDEGELSPSPDASYFNMRDEIDSRMEMLRQENQLPYFQLGEISPCAVYALQERINKCMYAKQMSPARTIAPPPLSIETLVYQGQYYSNENQLMLPSLSTTTLTSSDGYTSDDQNDEADSMVTQTGSYLDYRERFDSCMEILRLEESLSFLGIKQDPFASSV